MGEKETRESSDLAKARDSGDSSVPHGELRDLGQVGPPLCASAARKHLDQDCFPNSSQFYRIFARTVHHFYTLIFPFQRSFLKNNLATS